ncbi:MAG TPA: hypothetical protein VIK18_21190 [Pirellulales bacterium]
MSRQEEGARVLLLVVLMGAIIIAVMSYGCEHDPRAAPVNDDPFPVFLR